MRKILVGILAILILTIVGVFAVPGLINWNDYKGEISAQVEDATGRQLSIAGNISATVLPAPMIIINNVTFDSIPGANERHMVKLDSLEVRIALGPLLSGNIQIEKVRLVNPVIVLEVLPDGRKNWELEIPAKLPSSPSSSTPGSSLAFSEGPGVRLDNFELVNATVTYRDDSSGLIETIEKINGTFKMGSLQGPFNSVGSMVIRDIPISYDIGVEGIYQGRTAPIKAEIKLRDGLLETTFEGELTNLDANPEFNGETLIRGTSLGNLLDAFAPGTVLPPEFADSFKIQGTISGSADGLGVSDIQIDLGEVSASGELSAEFTDPLNATVSLLIDSIPYQGKKTGNVALKAELNGDEITLSQFSARLPGASEVILLGVISNLKDEPAFDGAVEVEVGNADKLGKWLGVDLGPAAKDKLKNIKSSMIIQATQQEIQLRKINLQFDKSKLSGAATIALRQRPGLGVSLSLDRINLDDYVAQTKTVTSNDTTISSQAETNSQQQTMADDDPLSALKSLGFLSDFDANAKLRIGELVFNGIKARKIVLDTTLVKNVLNLNDVRVDDLAGAKIALNGSLANLNELPRFDNLKVSFEARSIAALSEAFALELPIPARKIGKVSLSATFDGPALQPTINTKIFAIGATVSLDGKLSMLPTHPLIDVNVAFKHGDLAKLIKLSGSGYRPSGKIGGITLSTRIKGNLVDLKLSELKGSLGKIIFNGTAQAFLGDARPKLTANLNTGEIIVDPWLPADKSNGVSSGQSASSGTSSPSAQTTGNRVSWSRDKIDVSALHDFNADIQIKSPGLGYGNMRLKNAVVAITLENGILNARQISGTLFGGQVDLKGVLDARGVPDINTSLSISNLQMGNLFSALNDQGIATGTVTLNSAFTAKGSSVADLVSALNGSGSFDAKALDVKGSAKGTPLAGLLGIVRGLGQLGASLSGQSTESLADANGAFIITNGVMDLRNMALLSGLGNGNATGQIDLANWKLDISGIMHLAPNVLTQLLSLNTGIMQDFPFSVSGPIDDPDINFSIASQSGNNPQLPVIGEVPVIGNILEGVIGGILGGQIQTRTQTQQQLPPSQTQNQGSSDQPPPPPPQNGSQTQQQQPEQQIIKPEDILKQIFKF